MSYQGSGFKHCPPAGPEFSVSVWVLTNRFLPVDEERTEAFCGVQVWSAYEESAGSQQALLGLIRLD